MHNVRHNDCQQFIPVDVAKGICGQSGAEVFIDTAVCPAFCQAAKCKTCRHFTAGKDTLGTCHGFAQPDWTYADLAAGHCEKYQAVAE